MNPEKKEYIENWLYKANEDIEVTRHLLKDQPELYTGAICFHSHQAVEKFFKAYLIYSDIDFKKVHDLDYLLLQCINLNQEVFSSIELESLSEYGVSIRYPDDFNIPTVSEANKYQSIAETVRKTVLNSIRIE